MFILNIIFIDDLKKIYWVIDIIFFLNDRKLFKIKRIFVVGIFYFDR